MDQGNLLQEVLYKLALSEYSYSPDIQSLVNKLEESQDGLKEVISHFLDGQWLQILETSPIATELKNIVKNFKIGMDQYDHLVEGCCSLCEKNSDLEGAIKLVLVALCFMNVFTRVNWTGPPLTNDELTHADKFDERLGECLINQFNDGRGGFCTVAECYTHLWLAAVILLKARILSDSVKLIYVWKIKLLYIFQEILDDASPILQTAYADLIKQDDLFDGLPRDVAANLCLECMHLSLRFYDYNRAKEFMNKAGDLLGLNVTLEGVMGKRTRFQQKELPQMRLAVERKVPPEAARKSDSEPTQREFLPKNVALDNEVLLPDIKYSSTDDTVDLSPVEQAYVVSSSFYLRKTKPRDALTPEELVPYSEYVARQPKAWSVHCQALYLRSMLERNLSRKVERALAQMEEIVKCYHSKTVKPECRIKLLGCVGVSPRWVYEKDLGHLLISLGSTKTALDIFLRIQEWQEVIRCYQSLGSHEKAINIIKEQLAIKETPKLWCLLGDATGDTVHYHKAWELSGKKFAKAQASLGFWHMKKGKLEECIPFFEKSLELNYLQPTVWFALGFAAMASKQYAMGAKAYQNAVIVDSENFEAWANLASCLVRIGQKEKALRALKEAVRINYEDWRVWENYSLVAIDVGDFREVITACNRLLDLKRKAADPEVLSILVKAVIGDLRDKNGEPASTLLAMVKKLFGRITSQVTSQSEMWALYADLYSTSISSEDKYKVYQYLTKAVKCKVDLEQWKNDRSEATALIKLAERLKIASLDLIQDTSYENQKTQLCATPRLLMTSLDSRLKDRYGMEWDGVAALSSYIKDLTLD